MQGDVTIHGKTFNKYISSDDIRREVIRLANDIKRDSTNSKPFFVCVLNGSFVFAADLLRYIDTPCDVCFVRLSSYKGTVSSGTVKSVIGLDYNVKGRDVIIVEDIVETGRTMQSLLFTLSEAGANSVRIATLVSKPSRLQSDITITYCGFKMKETDFIVGYGLDYDGEGRNLPDIYIAANNNDTTKI